MGRMQFIRCRTCGRYLSPETAVSGRYCSPECAATFAGCSNCGRYFEVGAGYREAYCSEACAVQYRLTRRLGTEPLIALTEEPV